MAETIPSKTKSKTAVIVIHGIGEQRPMDTLWGFVKAVWSDDQSLVSEDDNVLYAKPDVHSNNFELRRVTTRYWTTPAPRKRVDFFEFYWAHLMQGNSTKSIASWLWALFYRKPSAVPPGFVSLWVIGWIFIGVAALFGLNSVWPYLPNFGSGTAWVSALLSLGSALLGFLVQSFLIPYIGDAARYLSADPDNVAKRQEIREKGIRLLDSLHENPDYDRIILVGHSLGSVIAMDILNFAWGSIAHEKFIKSHQKGQAIYKSLQKLEQKAKILKEAAEKDIAVSRKVFRDAQREYAGLLAQQTVEDQGTTRSLWQVSDFVTLGSPLSKASLLIARTPRAFKEKQLRREIPMNPPLGEVESGGKFSWVPKAGCRIPHHGAVFAPVVWTNIYFRNFFVVFGDIIGGPVRGLFGRGILDVKLSIGAPKPRHTHYWIQSNINPSRPWIIALRNALNLTHRNEEAIWGDLVSKLEISSKDLSSKGTE